MAKPHLTPACITEDELAVLAAMDSVERQGGTATLHAVCDGAVLRLVVMDRIVSLGGTRYGLTGLGRQALRCHVLVGRREGAR